MTVLPVILLTASIVYKILLRYYNALNVGLVFIQQQIIYHVSLALKLVVRPAVILILAYLVN